MGNRECDRPLWEHLLQPASLFGCSSVNMQTAQELQRFDQAAEKLHDLSESECGMIVCARCGGPAISGKAALEGLPCN